MIFLFSSRSVIETTEIYWQDFIVKKTAHLTEFAILAILLYRALLSEKVKKEKIIFWTLAFSIIYAFSDEFHQSFIPGREPRLRDVAIDGFGSLFSLYWVLKILPKMSPKIRLVFKKLEIN